MYIGLSYSAGQNLEIMIVDVQYLMNRVVSIGFSIEFCVFRYFAYSVLQIIT